METSNAIFVRAKPSTVYGLAAAVERWPEILPHYRWVREISRDGDSRVVEMAAHRDGFPVKWWAEQRCDPREPRITFRHVRGITRGMDVQWVFEPTADGVNVRIDHQLRLAWPLIGGFVADRVVGPLFVANIAGKTLRHIKSLAEDAERSEP